MLISRKVVRLKWQIPPSLAADYMHFFNGIQSTRAFFLLTFLLWLQVQRGEAFKVFKSPYLKGFLGPSSCLSLSTVVDSHLLCSMRQKSFSYYNFLLQKFVSFSPKNGNHQQNTKIHSVAQTDLKRNLTFMK